MGYVTIDYYYNDFGGELTDEASFLPLCERAGEIVEEMTMYRVTPVTVLAMPEDIQNRIKKAVCAQIEYLDANGEVTWTMGILCRVRVLESSIILCHLVLMAAQGNPCTRQERLGF